MMRDERHLRGRSEIRLDRMHLIWLTLGGLVTLSVAFALGVVVGRRAARFSEAQPTTATPADPLARIDAASDVRDKLTFYDKLTTDRDTAPLARPQAATAVSPPKHAVASSPAAPASVGTPVGAAPTAPPAADANAGARAALAKGPAQSGEYTIQVSAFQSSAEANAFAAGLKRKGFTPFIVKAEVAGKGTWYRVRLGRFSDDAEAARAKQLLTAADVPAWVVKSE